MENRVSNRSDRRLPWLVLAALAVIVAAFFTISHFGFLREDDILKSYETDSFADVFKGTGLFYLTKGGRWFSVACQYLFSGFLGGNRICFDVVNTLFFILLIWVCSALICTDGRKGDIRVYLVFALLFWFLCPEPGETLFWIAGSVTYLWSVSLTFLFLVVYLRCKDHDSGPWSKIGLFLFSVLAASEFIPCASICGAFVVYYLFHLKEFKGNAVPLIVGFAVGSMLVLFAPGNFARAAWEGQSYLSKLQYLVKHPLFEITKYKALWLFVLTLAAGLIRDKRTMRDWMGKNVILLLSLGWSVIAFSIVFRAENRALFFPETLSVILLMKCIRDNARVFGIRRFDDFFRQNGTWIKTACVALLFFLFCADATCGVIEASRQRRNNSALMEQLADAGGIVALDRMVPAHRMTYVERFPEWDWESVADYVGVDSVHVYPYYCQDKYFAGQDQDLENTFVEDLFVGDDSMGRLVRIIVRAKEEDVLAANGHVTVTADYSRPRKWYKSWLDKLRNYQYDRTLTQVFDEPEICFGGYVYYVFWMKRENAGNLRHVKISLE